MSAFAQKITDTYAALITTSAADRTVNYVYGPEHQRVRQSLALSGNGTSAYFAGSTWYLNGEDSLGLTYEREVRDNGLTLQRHFLSALLPWSHSEQRELDEPSALDSV